jgi:hypothetical protein
MWIKFKKPSAHYYFVDQMGESNFRIELEEVWVPKDVGELEGLLLTIQNEPGKKILKHKIQQVVKEKAERLNNWSESWEDKDWDDSSATDWEDYIRDDDSSATDWEDYIRD